MPRGPTPMPDFRIDTTTPRAELDAAWFASLPWRVERVEQPAAAPEAPSKPHWQRKPVNPDEALAAFRQAMQGRGLVPPPEIIAGGDIHRCDTTGKNGDGDGAYL